MIVLDNATWLWPVGRGCANSLSWIAFSTSEQTWSPTHYHSEIAEIDPAVCRFADTHTEAGGALLHHPLQ